MVPEEKILLAIYTELEKDQSNISGTINSKKLGLDFTVFSEAVEQLLNKGLICNAGVIRAGMCQRPVEVFLSSVKLTRAGKNCVERILKDL